MCIQWLKYFFSPTSDGGAAALICSEDFIRKHGLEKKAVEILAMEMATDMPGLFTGKSAIKLVGIFKHFLGN